MGRNLIKFLNELPTSTESDKQEVENTEEESKVKDGLADEDWEWWCNLSDTSKYLLLYRIEYYLEEPLPTLDDDTEELEAEWDLYDRNGSIGKYVGEYFTGYYKDGHFIYPQVYDLEVPETSISRAYLHEFAHLKHLEELSLYRLWIDALPSSFGQLTQLEGLNLARTDLTAQSLDVLRPLKNLRRLNLHSCVIKSIPQSIIELKNLVNLNLGFCWLEKNELKKLVDLPNLEILDVSGNDDLEEIPLELNQLNLTELNVGYCKFKASEIAKLATFTSLEQLDISNNEVTAETLEKLASLTNLESLTLSGFDEDSEEIAKLKAKLPNCDIYFVN